MTDYEGPLCQLGFVTCTSACCTMPGMTKTTQHLEARGRIDRMIEEGRSQAPFEAGNMLRELRGSYRRITDGWHAFDESWCKEAAFLDDLDLIEMKPSDRNREILIRRASV